MKDRYEVPASRWALIKEGSPHIGDSGTSLDAVSVDLEERRLVLEPNVVELGKAVRCGSLTARSYSAQDWWQTTPIEEFLEVDEDKRSFKFRTRSGSTYTLTGEV